MVGLSPCTGLSAYVLREGARFDHDGLRQLMRTVMALGVLLVVPMAAVFALGAPLLGRAMRDPTVGTLLPSLAVFLLATNLLHTATTVYRYRRQFGRMAALHSVQGLLQFLAIPMYWWMGVAGLGWGYAIGGVVALAVVTAVQRDALFRRPMWTPSHVRGAWRVWWPVSLSAALFLSVGYLDRVMIGWWWHEADVAVFFAAAATARVLTVPVAQLSILMFSLLGQYHLSSHFSRRFYLGYFLAACGGGVALYFIGHPIGRFVIGLLYHKVAADAAPLWAWTLGAAACLVIQLSVRPFINKFLSPRTLPWLSGVSAVFRLLPLIVLVPSGGALGAAQAMFVGGALTALVWAGVYLWSFVLAGRARETSADAAEPASGPEGPGSQASHEDTTIEP
jgi:O-antigen/teichoic acid export membrane protein